MGKDTYVSPEGFREVGWMSWLRHGEFGRSAKAVAEAERAERAAKMARLKSLRTQLLLAEAGLQVSFAEELDCSLLLAALKDPGSAVPSASATRRTEREQCAIRIFPTASPSSSNTST